MGAMLLVFNIYLMYSTMLIIAPMFKGFTVFILLLLGVLQVILITIGALYFLLSGSDKSRLLMICSVTHAFTMLLGSITYFYQQNIFLMVMTRVTFLSFLVAFYFYMIYEEVPRFRIDLDDDGSSSV